jgi:phosphatidylglycerophosphate synthase
MSARATPVALAQIPNALTLLRFALIPVFIALMLLKEDRHETDLPEWQRVFGWGTSVERGVMFSQAGNLHRAD